MKSASQGQSLQQTALRQALSDDGVLDGVEDHSYVGSVGGARDMHIHLAGRVGLLLLSREELVLDVTRGVVKRVRASYNMQRREKINRRSCNWMD